MKVRQIALGFALLGGIAFAMSLAINPINQGPFYVSPSGSDSTGNGSSGNPWRQPQHAADAIRALKVNQVMSQDITVNLAAGTYAPFSLGQLDSGFNGHTMRYVSSAGPALAVIDAGVAVTGWTLVSGSTYKASVPNTFSTVYENNVRSTHARYPNWSMSAGFTSTREPYLISATDSPNLLTRLAYTPGDFTGGFSPSTVSVTDLRVTSFCGGFWEWNTTTSAVASVDSVNHFINFTSHCKFPTFNSVGSRYFVEGTIEMLDAPGEWYLDKGAMQLYYIARDGPIASQSIVIPTTTEAVKIEGISQKAGGDRASNIVIDGLAVRHTDFSDTFVRGWQVSAPGVIEYPVPTPWVYPFFAWLANQPQYKLGAVHLRNADHVTLQNMLIEDVGMYGVFCDGWCENNLIQHDWIRRIGGGAVRIEGQFPGLGDWASNNEIYDFRFNNVGEMSGEGSGIDIAQSGANTVHYGYIFNGPRKGIWVLASTGNAGIPFTIYTVGNVIDHVKLQFLGQDSADTGALGFDSLSSVSPNFNVNSASQMVIDHVIANTSIRDIAPDGILNDDESAGTQFSNIWVTNVADQQMRPNTVPATPVNCSFLIDGTPNGSFNSSLVDVANIGTTSSFPWPCTTWDATGKCTSNPDPG